jgi:hypothetical protein
MLQALRYLDYDFILRTRYSLRNRFYYLLAAYSLDLWEGVDRHYFDAIVSPQDFQDTYFPAFEV